MNVVVVVERAVHVVVETPVLVLDAEFVDVVLVAFHVERVVEECPRVEFVAVRIGTMGKADVGLGPSLEALFAIVVTDEMGGVHFGDGLIVETEVGIVRFVVVGACSFEAHFGGIDGPQGHEDGEEHDG